MAWRMSSPSDFSQMHELCHLRSTLEAFAVARLHGCPERGLVLERLSASVRAMERAARRADYERFHVHDLEFHRILVDNCKLPALRKSWEIVAAELDDWLQELKKVYWPNLMTLHYEHILLLEALKSPLHWVGERAVHQHIEAGWYRIALSEGETPAGPDAIAKADAFISTHFSSDFDMEFVARHVSFVSPSHFNRLFRKKFGISPYARLRQTRMGHAAELLQNTDTKISELGSRVGYRNSSHFIKDFRAIYGKTPAQYRRGMTAAASTST
jgi:AraC-like DNA-binding protein